jgi:DNA-binding protein Fis
MPRGDTTTTSDVFRAALAGKEIPILTLDNKWNQLFVQYRPTFRIKRGAREVNNLLKRQGKLTNDIKDLRKTRKRLMDEIVGLADEVEQGNSNSEKRLATTKKIIDDCKKKMEKYEQELNELPPKLEAANFNLMISTMEVCYERFKDNAAQIKEIGDWVTQIRAELKEKVVIKKETETANNTLYQYMHQVFGAEVIEIFDMEYLLGAAIQAIVAKNEEEKAVPLIGLATSRTDKKE